MNTLLVSCRVTSEFSEQDLAQVAQSPPASSKSLAMDGTTRTAVQKAADIFGSNSVSAFSFSFWYKSSASAPAAALFESDSDLESSVKIWLDPSLGNLRTEYDLGNSGAHVLLIVTATITKVDQWNHYVLTFSHDPALALVKSKLFINGQVASEASATADPLYFLASRNFFLLSPTSPLTDGNLDEVSLWTSTLDPTQVKSLYNRGLPMNLSHFTPAFRSWWRMGESFQAMNLVDESGFSTVAINKTPQFENSVPSFDPFTGDIGSDPLNQTTPGQDSGSSSSGNGGGSDPLVGGNGGFGGELGGGNSGGGVFP